MQIQIETDHHIHGHEALSEHVRTVVTHALGHQSEHLTRVEVHLVDENGPKTGPDLVRCAMVARLERHQPLTITADAPSAHQAIASAADKLTQLVRHTLDKARSERRQRTDPPGTSAEVSIQT